MARTADQVLDELRSLMPTGWAWPVMRQADSNTGKLAGAFAAGLSAAEVAADGILDEINPAQASYMLTDYERVLGNDPCLGDPREFSTALRQQIAYSRWVGQGVCSAAELISLAATYGYTITIDEFVPARVGSFRVGQPLYGAEWANIWRIVGPPTQVTPFRVGQSRVGDKLQSWGDTRFECLMRRATPAHTVLLIAYTGTASVLIYGSGIYGRDTYG